MLPDNTANWEPGLISPEKQIPSIVTTAPTPEKTSIKTGWWDKFKDGLNKGTGTIDGFLDSLHNLFSPTVNANVAMDQKSILMLIGALGVLLILATGKK